MPSLEAGALFAQVLDIHKVKTSSSALSQPLLPTNFRVFVVGNPSSLVCSRCYFAL
jgi:hypothetical protein